MVDKEKVARYIWEMEKYINQLKELENIKKEEYLKDWKIYHLVERCLHLSLETFLALGNMLISELSLRKPDSYSDIPNILFEKGILSYDLNFLLQDLARFRNVLVHEYLSINKEIVYEKFKEVPNILIRFLEEIKGFLKNESY